MDDESPGSPRDSQQDPRPSPTRGSQIMAGHDFSFATDNDPYLQDIREIGSGGIRFSS